MKSTRQSEELAFKQCSLPWPSGPATGSGEYQCFALRLERTISRPREEATSTNARTNRSTSGVFFFFFFFFFPSTFSHPRPSRLAFEAHSVSPSPSTKPTPNRSRLTTSKTFSEEEVSLFARLCGDSNPLHQGKRRQQSGSSTSSSSSYSSSASQVLVPGLLTASLFPGLIGTAVPRSVYLSQSLRFSAPLRAGERVEVEVAVASKKVLPFGRVASSSSNSSSSSGLLLQMLQLQRQQQKKQGGEGERGGRGEEEEASAKKTTRAATTTGENGKGAALLPTSFVRAKLGTRAWKSGSAVVIVEGEAEALWPVY